jgi:hypothetical protein
MRQEQSEGNSGPTRMSAYRTATNLPMDYSARKTSNSHATCCAVLSSDSRLPSGVQFLRKAVEDLRGASPGACGTPSGTWLAGGY